MPTKLLLIGFSIVLLYACSTETIKRTTYGTLQNIEHQQCAKDFGSDCPKSDSYEEYQKKRDQELDSDHARP